MNWRLARLADDTLAVLDGSGGVVAWWMRGAWYRETKGAHGGVEYVVVDDPDALERIRALCGGGGDNA